MTDPALTPEALDTIEARANAATSGPWYQGRDDRQYEDSREVYTRKDMDDPESYDVFPHAAYRREDAAFVAHAREDIPALVVELRRLRTENEEHKSGTYADTMRRALDASEAEVIALQAKIDAAPHGRECDYFKAVQFRCDCWKSRAALTGEATT